MDSQGPPAGGAQPGEDVDPELFARVVELLRMHRGEEQDAALQVELEDATARLREFSVRYPDSIPALRLLSECARQLGDLQEARACIARAELLDPWNPEILIISESLYESEKAPSRIRSAFHAGSVNADTLQEKAMGLFRLGELERAYSLTKLALTIDRYNGHQLMNVFAVGSALDPGRLHRELLPLAAGQPDDPPAYLYLALGSACNVLADYAEAVTWLTKGLELEPEDPYLLAMLYNELAYVMAKQAVDLERCVALARTAVEVFPDRQANGFIRDTLGVAYLKKGDIRKALQNLREAVRKDPTVIPRFHLALALLHEHDAAGALAELRHLASGRPSLESPHVEESAILERVQSHMTRIEDLLNLGGADDIRDALGILDGLI